MSEPNQSNLNTSQLNPPLNTSAPPPLQIARTVSSSSSNRDVFVWSILRTIQTYHYMGASFPTFESWPLMKGTREDLNEWVNLHIVPDAVHSMRDMIFQTPAQNEVILLQSPLFSAELPGEDGTTLASISYIINGTRESSIRHLQSDYLSQESNENVTPFIFNRNNNSNANPTPRPNARRRTERKRRR